MILFKKKATSLSYLYKKENWVMKNRIKIKIKRDFFFFLYNFYINIHNYV